MKAEDEKIVILTLSSFMRAAASVTSQVRVASVLRRTTGLGCWCLETMWGDP